jgi:hypothetical protein
MIMMHVLLTIAIAKKVVKPKRLFAMTTTPVPKILATQVLDANMKRLNVMTTTLVLPIAVIPPRDVPTNL